MLKKVFALTAVGTTVLAIGASAGASASATGAIQPNVTHTKTVGCDANFANTKGYIKETETSRNGVYLNTVYYKMESGWPGGSQNWIQVTDYAGQNVTTFKRTKLGKHYSWTKLASYYRVPGGYNQRFYFHFDLSGMTDTSCTINTKF